MTTFLVDAYAWIEYFRGSKQGQKVSQLFLDMQNSFVTVESNVAEVRLWALRGNQDFDKLFQAIRANSTLSPLTIQDWLEAAIVRNGMRKTREHFGLIDAILIVKQKELRCKIISGDKHFKGLPGVVFIE